MYVSKCNGLMYNISCSTIISLRTAELPIQERSREEFNNRSNATSIKLFKLDTLHFCTLEKRIVWKKNRVESNWNAYKQRILYRGRTLIFLDRGKKHIVCIELAEDVER